MAPDHRAQAHRNPIGQGVDNYLLPSPKSMLIAPCHLFHGSGGRAGR